MWISEFARTCNALITPIMFKWIGEYASNTLLTPIMFKWIGSVNYYINSLLTRQFTTN